MAGGDHRIQSATFFADAGRLHPCRRPEGLRRRGSDRRRRTHDGRQGYLDGQTMATAFNMLRSDDLIWPYVVNNYMRGKDPLPFDLLYWNANSDAHAGGEPLLLSAQLLSREQAVAGQDGDRRRTARLAESRSRSTTSRQRGPHRPGALGLPRPRFFGGKVDFVLTGSGHIAGVVNPPARRSTSTGPAAPTAGPSTTGSAKATETPGSWWPHWQAWIEAGTIAGCRRTRPGGDEIQRQNRGRAGRLMSRVKA